MITVIIMIITIIITMMIIIMIIIIIIMIIIIINDYDNLRLGNRKLSFVWIRQAHAW